MGQRVSTGPWAAHRRRGESLRERYPYAAQVLSLYLALADVWDAARQRAGDDKPEPEDLPDWVAVHVVPDVTVATVAYGPELLAQAVADVNPVPAIAGWLAGTELPPVERYLARAALRGPLDVLDAAAACAGDPSPRTERTCPTCGGLPQLSYREDAADALVSGRRYLSCVRCAGSWQYASNSCACCGETSGAKRTVFTELRDKPAIGRADNAAMFPHVRIEACDRCSRYLIDVDLGVDARAVPEVDELAALPLDLFATERGLEKITPNLMGF
jgi:hypothetical protein